jgi:hypothetical protein
MGFEVCYHFNEKLDGDYNKGESKTFKKKVGDPFEDVPLEKLAASITAQLARRDIFISDVEVYELSRKKVSFKETKGGIVIKNKKFLFDSTDASVTCIELEMEEEEEGLPPPQPTAVSHPKCSARNENLQQLHPHESLSASRPRRPVDLVVFAPEPQQIPELKRKNLSFTVDKKYEVLEKKLSPTGIGELYVLKDDKGNEQTVPDLYFIPGSVNLFGDKELGFSESEQRDEPNLLWGNASIDPSMPDIRRR